MATSRLQRIGTIYSRITGLLRSEALKPSSKPIWYDIYQNFPPKYPPKFDRPEPNLDVPDILYPEDVIRGRLNKEKSFFRGSVNLLDNERLSNSQKCIAYFEQFKEETGNEDEAYAKAVERISSEIPKKPESSSPSTPSLAQEFKKSKGIDVKSFLEK